MSDHLHLAEWGCARLPNAEIAPLRRRIPAWAPADTAHHFLKYADEQTVLAVQAFDNLIARSGRQPAARPVLAAPQLFGRMSGAGILHKFRTGGAAAVSPHAIPQHSLHSVSGALSILLGSHAANVGVGGGPDALAEGLLAAATLFTPGAAGVWLVATGFDPEPLPGDIRASDQAVGFAAVLALEPAAARQPPAREPALGTLVLSAEPSATSLGGAAGRSPTLPELVACLAASESALQPQHLAWRYPGGVGLELTLNPAVAVRRAA